MKTIFIMLIGALFLMMLPGCLTKQTTTDSKGTVIDEKYILKRPVKNVIENLEVE